MDPRAQGVQGGPHWRGRGPKEVPVRVVQAEGRDKLVLVPSREATIKPGVTKDGNPLDILAFKDLEVTHIGHEDVRDRERTERVKEASVAIAGRGYKYGSNVYKRKYKLQRRRILDEMKVIKAVRGQPRLPDWVRAEVRDQYVNITSLVYVLPDGGTYRIPVWVG